MKIYQALEQLFGFQINSTQEIPSYMNMRSSTGKFDEPKKEAVLIMLLSRVAKLEEKIEFMESAPVNPSNSTIVIEAAPVPVKKRRRRKKVKKVL